MLPKYHIAFGFLFCLVLELLFPSIKLPFIFLTFLASFLIDFDHYLTAVIKTKSLSFSKAYSHHIEEGKKWMIKHKMGLREKEHFHVLHTIEFITFVGILSFVWVGFFYIFIGLVFHSLLDIIHLLHHNILYIREFTLGNWITKRLRKN